MSTRPAIARLKVTLEDVEPAVMRRLDVPLRIRLDRLHLVLQAAMGWTNSHLYEFRAGGASWATPIPTSRAGHCRQDHALRHHRGYRRPDDSLSLRLWRRLGPRRQHRAHRRARPAGSLPAARRRNGPLPARGWAGPGHAEFLAAIADPTHEEHQHMLSWCGGAFDPNSPDIEHIADQLDRLLADGRRVRKPKTTSPRS